MDGERLSPLTYSVEAHQGETSAQRAIFAGAAVVAAVVFVSIVGGWILLGQIEAAEVVQRGGPVLVLVSGPVVAFVASRGIWKKARRTALLVVVGVTLLATAFTSTILGNVKQAMPQVRRAVDAIDLPAGFRLIDEETSGDRLCRRGCPTIERRYAAPATDPDPVSTLVLTMFAQGWERTSDVEPRFATTAAKDGLTAQLAENDPHVVELRVTRDK